MLCDLLIERDSFEPGIVADTILTTSHGGLGRIARTLQSAFNGMDGQCIALPVGSTLGSIAALVAVLDCRQACALMPADSFKPEDAPAFCSSYLEVSAGAAPDDISARLVPIEGRAPAKVDPGVLYVRTSGSTGTPKWVMHDVDRLISNFEGVLERLKVNEGDRVLIPVPIHHMYGFGAGLMPSLLAGASVMVVARGNPLDIFAAEDQFDPTFAFMVPSQCYSLTAMRRTPRRYRAITVAGDRLLPEAARAFDAKNGTFIALYGSTEMGVIAAAEPDMPPEQRLTSGLLLAPGVRFCDGAPGPEDGPSEIKVMHTAGHLGYAAQDGSLSNPAPACWPTGDLGWVADGVLHVVGRSDHSVKRDGLFVHFGEIEKVLASLAGVAAAVVVPAGITRRGVGLTAFCALDGSSDQTEHDLRRQCINALPARAVPDRFVMCDALPTLQSGKYDRPALVKRAEQLASSA